jgi:predicted RecA/RadA family phage recombinase
MSTKFISPGTVLDGLVAPTGGVTVDVGVLVQNVVVVPQSTVAQTLTFSGYVEGVFTMAKASGNAWAVGQNLYWDTANNNWVTAQSATARRAGIAAAAAGSSDTTGAVKLNNIGAAVNVA